MPNRILVVLQVYAVFMFLMGNVCNRLYRPYAPQHRATTCLEILQNDQRINFMCQSFYVEAVAQTEKSRYPAARLKRSLKCKQTLHFQ